LHGRQVKIPRYFYQPTRAAPIFGGGQQGCGRLRIIRTVKITKIAAFQTMNTIGRTMNMGGDPPDGPAISVGGEIRQRAVAGAGQQRVLRR